MSNDKEYDPLQALGNLVGNPEAHEVGPEFDQELEMDLESELTRGLEENTTSPAVEDASSGVLAGVDFSAGPAELSPLVSASDEPGYAKPVLQSFEDLKSAFESNPDEDAAPASDVVWNGGGFVSAEAALEHNDNTAPEIEEFTPEVDVTADAQLLAAEIADVEPVEVSEASGGYVPTGGEVLGDISDGKIETLYQEQFEPEQVSDEPHMPGEALPVEDNFAEDNFAEDTFADDTPVDEFPVEDTYVDDISVEEIPAVVAEQAVEPVLEVVEEPVSVETQEEMDGALDDVLAAEFEAAMANDAVDLADEVVSTVLEVPVPAMPVQTPDIHMPPVATPFDVQVDTALDEMQTETNSTDAEIGWSGELAGELEKILADSPSDMPEIAVDDAVYAEAANAPSAAVPATILAFKQDFASDAAVDLNEDLVAPVEAEAVAAPQSPKRGMRAAAMLLGVAIVGGSGVFGWSYFNESAPSGPAKIILASTAKVKVKPKEPGGKKIPNQNQLVYQKVNGKPETKPKQVRLASGAEKPVRVVSTSAAIPAVQTGSAQPAKPAVRVSAEDTILERSESAIVQPRRVRTVLIRPDGTIIARPVAKKAPVKVAAKTVAPKKIVRTVSTEKIPAKSIVTGATAMPTPVKVVSLKPAAKPVVKTIQSSSSATTPGIVMPRTSAPRIVAQPPVVKTTAAPRVVKTPAQKIVQPRVVKTVKPKVKPAAAAPVTRTASTGGYVMQIASRKSAEAAQTSYNKLSRRFSSVLGGRGVDIRRFKLKKKGIYYRVRIPAGSKSAALKLCKRYKSAGGSCFVTR